MQIKNKEDLSYIARIDGCVINFDYKMHSDIKGPIIVALSIEIPTLFNFIRVVKSHKGIELI